MPRGNNIHESQALLKALILGDPKSGKTDWTIRAALAGFKVLYLDGDVAVQTIASLPEAAKANIFYMAIGDDLMGDTCNPKMIQIVADFLTSTRFLWNDTKQQEYSRSKDSHDPETGAALDEIWELRPSRLDNTWVLAIDSWSTLSYSAMLAKSLDMGVQLADIEKVERGIYAGVGNRLTNILITLQKAPCHVVVIGHPAEYAKMKNPDKEVLKGIKELDKITEWTRMIPKSSSNPHGLTMGKYFSDVGWIDVDKWGKRQLNFKVTNERVSGGHLDNAGDPRLTHSFSELVKAIGGTLPADPNNLGEGLTIHSPGTFIPVAGKALPGKPSPASTPLSQSATPTQVKGLGGLAGLGRK